MISGFFGLPGVGKTSFLAKIAHKENIRMQNVRVWKIKPHL